MKTDPISYDLKQMCAEADVTPRTVHFYIQQGLLPPAGSAGPGARYGREHLYRLRLIRLLQKEHLPLSEIRRRLESLTDSQVEELASGHRRREPPSKSSAVDYIRGILAGESSLVPKPSVQALSRNLNDNLVLQGSAGHHSSARMSERSQWERITLTPDVELHFRRPLSRAQNRKVEALIQYARETFKEE